MGVEKLKIGISSCLLGNEVRYDGGHKRDRFVTDLLSDYADFISVCPEVEFGMGIPREPVRLVRDGDRTRMVAVTTKHDYTDAMEEFVRRRVEQLQSEHLDGFILKSKSPSCGMERVNVYSGEMPSKTGVGKFAAALIAAMPHLPIEDERRLNAPRFRENFVRRCYAWRRWQQMVNSDLSRKSLIDFHECHKYLLMAHNQAGMRRLSRIVANPQDYASTKAMAEAYIAEFANVMRRTPTRENHTNVLLHMLRCLHKLMPNDDRQKLSELITAYRNGERPLIAPMTLLRHSARKHEPENLLSQVYLQPHPAELMLLNLL